MGRRKSKISLLASLDAPISTLTALNITDNELCLDPRLQNSSLFRIFRTNAGTSVKPAKKLRSKPKGVTKGPAKAVNQSRPLSKGIDARSKIIQKNRVKIRDARERIAENARKSIKDARQLISAKQPNPQKKVSIPRSKPNRSLQPELLMDDDDFDIEDLSALHLKPIGTLKRTVRNEMFHRSAPPVTMPKLPSFNFNHDPRSSSPDPFDCYNTVPSWARPGMPVPPSLRTVDRYHPGRAMSAHMDAYEPRKSILRSSQSTEHDDRFEDDRYVSISKDGVRSRLFNESRDRNESAGIFANLPVRPTPPPSAQVGHRIVVSNLHSTVNESDVRELFEDVGPLVSARMARVGVAEVVYKNHGDAEEAVEAYHNRQLDGQPMKCMLVKSDSKLYSRF